MPDPDHVTDSLDHLVRALAFEPDERRAALERLVRVAGRQVLALESTAAHAGGSVWVFDTERAAQTNASDPPSVAVERMDLAETRLLLTTWRANDGTAEIPVLPPADLYYLCLVDGNDVRCLPIAPRRRLGLRSAHACEVADTAA
jgi:hypothetical protein